MNSRERLEQMLLDIYEEMSPTKKQECLLTLIQKAETADLIMLIEGMMKS